MAGTAYYARIMQIDLEAEPGVFPYAVDFPDLPGCVTVGYSREDAIEMAKEALELWLDVEGEEEWPPVVFNPPSNLDSFLDREDELAYENELSHEYVLIELCGE
jgi:predicted RNase H-like HicB family nuclease